MPRRRKGLLFPQSSSTTNAQDHRQGLDERSSDPAQDFRFDVEASGTTQANEELHGGFHCGRRGMQAGFLAPHGEYSSRRPPHQRPNALSSDSLPAGWEGRPPSTAHLSFIQPEVHCSSNAMLESDINGEEPQRQAQAPAQDQEEDAQCFHSSARRGEKRNDETLKEPGVAGIRSSGGGGTPSWNTGFRTGRAINDSFYSHLHEHMTAGVPHSGTGHPFWHSGSPMHSTSSVAAPVSQLQLHLVEGMDSDSRGTLTAGLRSANSYSTTIAFSGSCATDFSPPGGVSRVESLKGLVPYVSFAAPASPNSSPNENKNVPSSRRNPHSPSAPGRLGSTAPLTSAVDGGDPTAVGPHARRYRSAAAPHTAAALPTSSGSGVTVSHTSGGDRASRRMGGSGMRSSLAVRTSTSAPTAGGGVAITGSSVLESSGSSVLPEMSPSYSMSSFPSGLTFNSATHTFVSAGGGDAAGRHSSNGKGNKPASVNLFKAIAARNSALLNYVAANRSKEHAEAIATQTQRSQKRKQLLANRRRVTSSGVFSASQQFFRNKPRGRRAPGGAPAPPAQGSTDAEIRSKHRADGRASNGSADDDRDDDGEDGHSASYAGMLTSTTPRLDGTHTSATAMGEGEPLAPFLSRGLALRQQRLHPRVGSRALREVSPQRNSSRTPRRHGSLYYPESAGRHSKRGGPKSATTTPRLGNLHRVEVLDGPLASPRATAAGVSRAAGREEEMSAAAAQREQSENQLTFTMQQLGTGKPFPVPHPLLQYMLAFPAEQRITPNTGLPSSNSNSSQTTKSPGLSLPSSPFIASGMTSARAALPTSSSFPSFSSGSAAAQGHGMQRTASKFVWMMWRMMENDFGAPQRASTAEPCSGEKALSEERHRGHPLPPFLRLSGIPFQFVFTFIDPNISTVRGEEAGSAGGGTAHSSLSTGTLGGLGKVMPYPIITAYGETALSVGEHWRAARPTKDGVNSSGKIDRYTQQKRSTEEKVVSSGEEENVASARSTTATQLQGGDPEGRGPTSSNSPQRRDSVPFPFHPLASFALHRPHSSAEGGRDDGSTNETKASILPNLSFAVSPEHDVISHLTSDRERSASLVSQTGSPTQTTTLSSPFVGPTASLLPPPNIKHVDPALLSAATGTASEWAEGTGGGRNAVVSVSPAAQHHPAVPRGLGVEALRFLGMDAAAGGSGALHPRVEAALKASSKYTLARLLEWVQPVAPNVPPQSRGRGKGGHRGTGAGTDSGLVFQGPMNTSSWAAYRNTLLGMKLHNEQTEVSKPRTNASNDGIILAPYNIRQYTAVLRGWQEDHLSTSSVTATAIMMASAIQQPQPQGNPLSSPQTPNAGPNHFIQNTFTPPMSTANNPTSTPTATAYHRTQSSSFIRQPNHCNQVVLPSTSNPCAVRLYTITASMVRKTSSRLVKEFIALRLTLFQRLTSLWKEHEQRQEHWRLELQAAEWRSRRQSRSDGKGTPTRNPAAVGQRKVKGSAGPSSSSTSSSGDSGSVHSLSSAFEDDLLYTQRGQQFATRATYQGENDELSRGLLDPSLKMEEGDHEALRFESEEDGVNMLERRRRSSVRHFLDLPTTNTNSFSLLSTDNVIPSTARSSTVGERKNGANGRTDKNNNTKPKSTKNSINCKSAPGKKGNLVKYPPVVQRGKGTERTFFTVGAGAASKTKANSDNMNVKGNNTGGLVDSNSRTHHLRRSSTTTVGSTTACSRPLNSAGRGAARGSLAVRGRASSGAAAGAVDTPTTSTTPSRAARPRGNPNSHKQPQRSPRQQPDTISPMAPFGEHEASGRKSAGIALKSSAGDTPPSFSNTPDRLPSSSGAGFTRGCTEQRKSRSFALRLEDSREGEERADCPANYTDGNLSSMLGSTPAPMEHDTEGGGRSSSLVAESLLLETEQPFEKGEQAGHPLWPASWYRTMLHTPFTVEVSPFEALLLQADEADLQALDLTSAASAIADGLFQRLQWYCGIDVPATEMTSGLPNAMTPSPASAESTCVLAHGAAINADLETAQGRRRGPTQVDTTTAAHPPPWYDYKPATADGSHGPPSETSQQHRSSLGLHPAWNLPVLTSTTTGPLGSPSSFRSRRSSKGLISHHPTHHHHSTNASNPSLISSKGQHSCNSESSLGILLKVVTPTTPQSPKSFVQQNCPQRSSGQQNSTSVREVEFAASSQPHQPPRRRSDGARWSSESASTSATRLATQEMKDSTCISSHQHVAAVKANELEETIKEDSPELVGEDDEVEVGEPLYMMPYLGVQLFTDKRFNKSYFMEPPPPTPTPQTLIPTCTPDELGVASPTAGGRGEFLDPKGNQNRDHRNLSQTFPFPKRTSPKPPPNMGRSASTQPIQSSTKRCLSKPLQRSNSESAVRLRGYPTNLHISIESSKAGEEGGVGMEEGIAKDAKAAMSALESVGDIRHRRGTEDDGAGEPRLSCEPEPEAAVHRQHPIPEDDESVFMVALSTPVVQQGNIHQVFRDWLQPHFLSTAVSNAAAGQGVGGSPLGLEEGVSSGVTASTSTPTLAEQEEVIRNIIRGVLTQLRVLHRQGVPHGGVTGSNVFSVYHVEQATRRTLLRSNKLSPFAAPPSAGGNGSPMKGTAPTTTPHSIATSLGQEENAVVSTPPKAEATTAVPLIYREVFRKRKVAPPSLELEGSREEETRDITLPSCSGAARRHSSGVLPPQVVVPVHRLYSPEKAFMHSLHAFQFPGYSTQTSGRGRRSSVPRHPQEGNSTVRLTNHHTEDNESCEQPSTPRRNNGTELRPTNPQQLRPLRDTSPSPPSPPPNGKPLSSSSGVVVCDGMGSSRMSQDFPTNTDINELQEPAQRTDRELLPSAARSPTRRPQHASDPHVTAVEDEANGGGGTPVVCQGPPPSRTVGTIAGFPSRGGATGISFAGASLSSCRTAREGPHCESHPSPHLLPRSAAPRLLGPSTVYWQDVPLQPSTEVSVAHLPVHIGVPAPLPAPLPLQSIPGRLLKEDSALHTAASDKSTRTFGINTTPLTTAKGNHSLTPLSAEISSTFSPRMPLVASSSTVGLHSAPRPTARNDRPFNSLSHGSEPPPTSTSTRIPPVTPLPLHALSGNHYNSSTGNPIQSVLPTTAGASSPLRWSSQVLLADRPHQRVEAACGMTIATELAQTLQAKLRRRPAPAFVDPTPSLAATAAPLTRNNNEWSASEAPAEGSPFASVGPNWSPTNTAECKTEFILPLSALKPASLKEEPTESRGVAATTGKPNRETKRTPTHKVKPALRKKKRDTVKEASPCDSKSQSQSSSRTTSVSSEEAKPTVTLSESHSCAPFSADCTPWMWEKSWFADLSYFPLIEAAGDAVPPPEWIQSELAWIPEGEEKSMLEDMCEPESPFRLRYPNTVKPSCRPTLASDVWMVGMLLMELTQLAEEFGTSGGRHSPRSAGGNLLPQHSYSSVHFQKEPLPLLASSVWSTALRLFVKRCVELDPLQRPSVNELLEDGWFTYDLSLEISKVRPQSARATTAAGHQGAPPDGVSSMAPSRDTPSPAVERCVTRNAQDAGRAALSMRTALGGALFATASPSTTSPTTAPPTSGVLITTTMPHPRAVPTDGVLSSVRGDAVGGPCRPTPTRVELFFSSSFGELLLAYHDLVFHDMEKRRARGLEVQKRERAEASRRYGRTCALTIPHDGGGERYGRKNCQQGDGLSEWEDSLNRSESFHRVTRGGSSTPDLSLGDLSMEKEEDIFQAHVLEPFTLPAAFQHLMERCADRTSEMIVSCTSSPNEHDRESLFTVFPSPHPWGPTTTGTNSVPSMMRSYDSDFPSPVPPLRGSADGGGIPFWASGSSHTMGHNTSAEAGFSVLSAAARSTSTETGMSSGTKPMVQRSSSEAPQSTSLSETICSIDLSQLSIRNTVAGNGDVGGGVASATITAALLASSVNSLKYAESQRGGSSKHAAAGRTNKGHPLAPNSMLTVLDPQQLMKEKYKSQHQRRMSLHQTSPMRSIVSYSSFLTAPHPQARTKAVSSTTDSRSSGELERDRRHCTAGGVDGASGDSSVSNTRENSSSSFYSSTDLMSSTTHSFEISSSPTVFSSSEHIHAEGSSSDSASSSVSPRQRHSTAAISKELRTSGSVRPSDHARIQQGNATLAATRSRTDSPVVAGLRSGKSTAPQWNSMHAASRMREGDTRCRPSSGKSTRASQNLGNSVSSPLLRNTQTKPTRDSRRSSRAMGSGGGRQPNTAPPTSITAKGQKSPGRNSSLSASVHNALGRSGFLTRVPSLMRSELVSGKEALSSSSAVIRSPSVNTTSSRTVAPPPQGGVVYIGAAVSAARMTQKKTAQDYWRANTSKGKQQPLEEQERAGGTPRGATVSSSQPRRPLSQSLRVSRLDETTASTLLQSGSTSVVDKGRHSNAHHSHHHSSRLTKKNRGVLRLPEAVLLNVLGFNHFLNLYDLVEGGEAADESNNDGFQDLYDSHEIEEVMDEDDNDTTVMIGDGHNFLSPTLRSGPGRAGNESTLGCTGPAGTRNKSEDHLTDTAVASTLKNTITAPSVKLTARPKANARQNSSLPLNVFIANKKKEIRRDRSQEKLDVPTKQRLIEDGSESEDTHDNDDEDGLGRTLRSSRSLMDITGETNRKKENVVLQSSSLTEKKETATASKNQRTTTGLDGSVKAFIAHSPLLRSSESRPLANSQSPPSQTSALTETMNGLKRKPQRGGDGVEAGEAEKAFFSLSHMARHTVQSMTQTFRSLEGHSTPGVPLSARSRGKAQLGDDRQHHNRHRHRSSRRLIVDEVVDGESDAPAAPPLSGDPEMSAMLIGAFAAAVEECRQLAKESHPAEVKAQMGQQPSASGKKRPRRGTRIHRKDLKRGKWEVYTSSSTSSRDENIIPMRERLDGPSTSRRYQSSGASPALVSGTTNLHPERAVAAIYNEVLLWMDHSEENTEENNTEAWNSVFSGVVKSEPDNWQEDDYPSEESSSSDDAETLTPPPQEGTKLFDMEAYEAELDAFFQHFLNLSHAFPLLAELWSVLLLEAMQRHPDTKNAVAGLTSLLPAPPCEDGEPSASAALHGGGGEAPPVGKAGGEAQTSTPMGGAGAGLDHDGEKEDDVSPSHIHHYELMKWSLAAASVLD